MARKFASSVKMAGDKAEAEKYWAARSAHFSDISSRAHTIVNEDVSVPRDKIAEFIQRGRETAKRYDVPISFAGHVGDGNFHPAVLTDNRDKEHFERALKCVDEIIEIALSWGASFPASTASGWKSSAF